ncbi:metallophosphoesterase, partial [Bacillus cereus]|nr:metallophosphoesterase [Bacillus cereus]
MLVLDDPEFTSGNRDDEHIVKSEIRKAKDGMHSVGFKVLLSHRPVFLESYADEQVDLVLSGHA